MIERRLELPFDPMGAAERVSGLAGVSFLHSGLTAYGLGRYSVLAAEPWKRFVCRGGVASVFEGGDLRREHAGSVFEAFEAELGATVEGTSGSLPFHGGAIGYFSYEAGRSLERSALGEVGEDEIEGRFSFYRGGLVFDHVEEATWLVAERGDWLSLVERFAEKAFGSSDGEGKPFRLLGGLASNFERGEFVEAVGGVRERIRRGEVYQVNLSQRFEGRCEGSGFDLFRRLGRESPAPYAAYLDFGDEQIVSSSPERFLRVDGRRVTTRPIKGTRAAGGGEAEAAANAAELASSEKDRSELLMIVDLERNDLGRVCEPGSVRVDDLFRLERYETVIHQTADVSGVLEDGRSAVDCVKAMFPGGSITGAPKIRSMQVIDELERGGRGVYTGSIGYFDVGGGADLNIAIRTLRVADGRLSFQVGGGIVWDSDPESEYEETLLKAKGMLKALEGKDDE